MNERGFSVSDVIAGWAITYVKGAYRRHDTKWNTRGICYKVDVLIDINMLQDGCFDIHKYGTNHPHLIMECESSGVNVAANGTLLHAHNQECVSKACY